MRLYSTPQSANNLEVSVLAIAETIAAASFSLWLAISYLETWDYVLAGACLAPLLLLRTDYSCQYAYDAFYKFDNFIEESGYFSNKKIFIPAFFLIVVFPLSLLFIRVSSVVLGLIFHPLKSLSQIPTNWMRNCICTDSIHPPEILAEIETSQVKDNLGMFVFSRFSNDFLDINISKYKLSLSSIFQSNLSSNSITRMFGLLISFAKVVGIDFLCIVIVLVMYSPSVIYRLSLKSTSIVWSPLLWIIPKATPKIKLLTRLKLIHNSSCGRLILVVSITVLILFVLKIALYTGVIKLNESLSKYIVLSKIEIFIESYNIPYWQVASALNSFLAVLLFFYASNRLIHFETGELNACEDNLTTDYTLRTATVIRTSLSLYTISCLFYIVLYNASLFELPPLGDKFFPWK